MSQQDRPKKRRTNAQLVRVGDRKILAEGLENHFWSDLYHTCMTASWPQFFGCYAAGFLALNFVFACLYWLGNAPIANARPGLEDLFYFSIETLATVGYGDMHPQTTYGHLVATVEIFTGMSSIAVVTGLIFARFARPRARVLFARIGVISDHQRQPTLMFRMANERRNMVSGATAKLWLIALEDTAEGKRLRRFRELTIERSENPIFALSWTIFHSLDETSPIHGLNAAQLEAVEANFVLTFSGLDETSGQHMHARKVYRWHELRFGHAYADILGTDESGAARIDYNKFHDTHEV